MERLHTLLHSLSPAETETLRRHLTYLTGSAEPETRTLRLAELILKDKKKKLTPSQYSRKLFGKVSLSALRLLKFRLRNKLFDSLLLDINLDRIENLDPT